jgi:hypothetical protein
MHFEYNKSYKLKKYKLFKDSALVGGSLDNTRNNMPAPHDLASSNTLQEGIINFQSNPIPATNNSVPRLAQQAAHQMVLDRQQGGETVEELRMQIQTLEQQIQTSSNTLEVSRKASTSAQTMTLDTGTILFHGSKTITDIDPNNIKLTPYGQRTLMTRFTTSEQNAKSDIGDCQGYSNSNGGAVHKFEVITAIDKIRLLENKEAGWEDNSKLEQDICLSLHNDEGSFNGVKFGNSDNYYICVPKDYLILLSTVKCVGENKTVVTFGDGL